MMKKLIPNLAGVLAALALTTAVALQAQTTTISPANAVWKYLDTGVEQGSAWLNLGFNDSSWSSGAAELGYGDGDETTVVSFGPDSGNKYTTTYFRRVFNVANPAAFSSVNFTLTYDDGAIVYVNGAEVFRINLPLGAINAATPAPATAPEPGIVNDTIPVGALFPGNNIVAVEIHQQSGASSDISFALELTGENDTTPPTIASLLPPTSAIVQSLNSIEVLFSEVVQGVDPSDLLINGQPATNITFGVPGQFVFTFPPPPTGQVTVAFAAGHGISDLSPNANAFQGGSWSYNVDPNILPATFFISEFMASNTRTLNDNYGNQTDWIEIFNPSATSGNLQGWFLTDDTNNLTKWKFPSVILSSAGYLVVFASGRNETNNPAFLHTSFQLNASGEYLALVNPSTNVVSEFHPAFPPQSDDVSYGRDRLNPAFTGYFLTPTPRVANSTSGAGISPEVTFSHNSRTFPTNQPLSVALTTPIPNAAIYYSFGTNVPGTNVGANVFRYTNPISVANTLAVRARAFAPGLLPGPLTTKTYIGLANQTNVLGFNSELPIMIIHNYGQGTFPADSSAERHIFLQTFENDCGSASMTNVPTLSVRGIAHPRGSSTLTGSSGKSAFFIEIRDEQDDDLEVPMLGLPPESDWVLYAPNNFEPALMHNPLAHQLSRDGGEYSSRTRFVELFLKDDSGTPGPITSTGFTGANGDYHGIYVLMEKIKRDNNRVNIEKLEPEHSSQPEVTGGYLFSIDRTDAGKGTISAGGAALNPLEPSWFEITNINRVAQRSYIQSYFNSFNAGLAGANLTNAFLAGGAVNTNHYSNYIDVESWARRHVHEVVTFNVDAFRLSGYFFKDRNKRIEYGPAWDYDRTQGSTDGRDMNPRVWSSSGGTDFFGFSPWWNQLFRAPDFWQAWIDRYQSERLPGGSLNLKNVNARIDEFYNELKDAQPRERTRWNIGTRGTNGSGAGTYLTEIAWKKNWYAARLNLIDTNLLDMPIISSPGGLIAPGYEVTLLPAAKAGTLIIYTTDGTDPRLPNGFISPSASQNNGAVTVTVNGNMRIVARSYNPAHRNQVGNLGPLINSIWSGPRAATFFTAVPPLRITELMYHPAAPAAGNTNDQDNYEYIEIRNIGPTALDVTGFRLRAGVDFNFPSATLAAGEYAVIVRNATAFVSRYGATPRILGAYSKDNLANDGERLVLEGRFREPILEFTYRDNWYPATDGNGFSLVIRDDTLAPSTWGDKAGWRASGQLSGTPGSADPGDPGIPAVVINEALTHTDPSPGDAIEIHNPTTSPVDIGNWNLTDDFGSPKYRIPAPSIIVAGGYVVFYQSNSFGLGTNGFALSSQGDEIYLYSADGNGQLTGYVQGFDFGAQANGSTFGRHTISTGDDHFVSQTTPTLGNANSDPLVGPVIISEIHYHPPDLLLSRGNVDNCIDEFVELHNVSTSTVQLFDPAAPANTWRLRDAVSFRFPMGTTIAANGYVLVVPIDPSDPGQANAFRERNNVPAKIPLYGPYGGKLDNSSDSVELTRPDNPNLDSVPYILVDKVNYSDTSPWPEAADGLGPTLQRRNVNAYGNDPANWIAAGSTAGSGYGGGTPPTIAAQPADVTTLATLPASFTVIATGAGPLTYQWRFNGSPISGATDATLVLPAITADQDGLYSCVVLNTSGAVISQDARLTVLIPANIILQPQDVLVFVKPDPQAAPTTNATFRVGATTLSPPVAYQWRFNGTNVPGATANSFTVTNVTTNSLGMVSCSVTDGVGTIFSSNAFLYPLIKPGFVPGGQPLSQTVAPGTLVGISCVVTGFPPPFTFEWRIGSVGVATNVVDSPVNVYTFISTNVPSVTKTYRAVVKNIAFPSPGIATAFADITTATDTDRDGILDSVEDATPGFNKNNPADAQADTDGDGMKNGEELIAGTNPNDRSSYLKTDQTTTPGVIHVQFLARANRTYSIEYTDALGSGVWKKFADVPARAADEVRSIPDPTGNPFRYYRIATPGSAP